MSRSRDLRDRISSVKKTKKITQAMKMVAAAKFKRAQQRVAQSKPYQHELETMLSTLVGHDSFEINSVFLQENGAKAEEAIIISGDRGLCGGFNNSLFKSIERQMFKDRSDLSVVTLGSKAEQFCKMNQYKTTASYVHLAEKVKLRDIARILRPTLERYKAGETGRVWLVYNEFKSAVSSEPVKKQLLPLAAPESIDVKDDYFFEPDKSTVIDHMISDYLDYVVYQALLESKAGEEGQRMAAMDAATDNASDMIRGLTLEYNRSRQAQITTELSEIVAGAEALVN